jgi:ferredoxin
VLSRLTCDVASAADVAEAQAAVQSAKARMGRQMPALDIRELLRESRESPHWADVAERCLTCGNCTMVCPTCFCTTTEDTTDLTGDHAERWQHWASCFELDFSYLHGGGVRLSGASRYRQWITHKLSTWHDQFGGSGCVGCGRCIAWCPVGIDITAEVARLAELRDAGQAGEEAGDDDA